jgi:hypothetical protein
MPAEADIGAGAVGLSAPVGSSNRAWLPPTRTFLLVSCAWFCRTVVGQRGPRQEGATILHTYHELDNVDDMVCQLDAVPVEAPDLLLAVVFQEVAVALLVPSLELSQLAVEKIPVKHLCEADAAPGAFDAVTWAIAPHYGAHSILAELDLLEAIDGGVQVEVDVTAVADQDARAGVLDAPGLDVSQPLEQGFTWKTTPEPTMLMYLGATRPAGRGYRSSCPCPHRPTCDPRMIWLMVVGLAGRTHPMPVEPEAKKARRKPRSARGAAQEIYCERPRLACAWLDLPQFSARMVGCAPAPSASR